MACTGKISCALQGVQVAKNKVRLAAKLAPDASPLDYYTTLRVIRDAAAALDKAPVISCEGANTMDNARCAAGSPPYA